MNRLHRLPDWQVRLAAFTRTRRKTPFAWGSHDCAGFAADAIEAQTGQKVLPELRGLGVRAAVRVLASRGGLRGIASEALGDQLSPVFAAVGDVVLITEGKREALAICNGTSALAAGPFGISVVPMKRALACWKV